jgi:hypothetical protein
VNTLTMLFKDRFGVKFNKKGEKVDPKEKLTGVMLPSLIGFLIVFVAPYSESHNLFVMVGGDALRYFGRIIFLAGYVSCWLCFYGLGSFAFRGALTKTQNPSLC